MADVYVALTPLLYVSKAIGLAPFFVDEASRELKPSFAGTLHSLALIALFAANSAYVIHEKIKTTSASYIGEFTDIVLLACRITVTLCVMALTIVQRNKIIAMVRSFRGIDADMAKLDVRMPYRQAFRVSCIVIAVLTVTLTLLLVHDILFWLPRDENFITFWLTYFSPVVYSTVMEYQFIAGGLLLRKNFARLNERLAKFGEERLPEAGPHLPNKPRAVPAWSGNFSRFRIRKTSPADTPGGDATLSKIKTIRKIHSGLCEIKELLNSTFSLQLLSIVAQAFVIITSNLYILFTSVSKSSGGGNAMSYPIIWTLCRTLELVFIVLTCTRTSIAGNQTAVLVHKLLAKEWDANVRNQLKLFSIQLLHRKISFSACGFFTLDMTLLHAIIGAATTYLVILIQFHNTYESS